MVKFKGITMPRLILEIIGFYVYNHKHKLLLIEIYESAIYSNKLFGYWKLYSILSNNSSEYPVVGKLNHRNLSYPFHLTKVEKYIIGPYNYCQCQQKSYYMRIWNYLFDPYIGKSVTSYNTSFMTQLMQHFYDPCLFFVAKLPQKYIFSSGSNNMYGFKDNHGLTHIERFFRCVHLCKIILQIILQFVKMICKTFTK